MLQMLANKDRKEDYTSGLDLIKVCSSIHRSMSKAKL